MAGGQGVLAAERSDLADGIDHRRSSRRDVSKVAVQACPAAIVSERRAGSATMANRIVDASSPSAGSGWAQMLSGAPSWSARIPTTPSVVGAAVEASVLARARRSWLHDDGGKVTSATDGSSAWFVWAFLA